jgi:hypothetical protein
MKNVLYLFLCGMLMLSIESCSQQKAKPETSLPENVYEVALDSSIQRYLDQYTQQMYLSKTEAVVTVNWTGIYGGQCVYVSNTIVHPQVNKQYPYFWASHRGYLVFVYDSKHNNRLAHPQLLRREVDEAITRHRIALRQQVQGLLFEPVSWRVTECKGRIRIDTTDVYAQLRDCP